MKQEHIVNYRGKNINAIQFFRHLGNRYVTCYYSYLAIGMNAQRAFDFVVHYDSDNKVDLDNAFNLETDIVPARETILKEYSDIKKFCIFYRISYRFFCKILKKHSDVNLRQALNYYYSEDARVVCSLPCSIIYGVSLEAICLKYQMDYQYCLIQIKLGKDIHLVIQNALVQSPLFSKNVSLQLKKYIPDILNLSYDVFKNFLKQNNFSLELNDFMIFYRYRYNQIMDALNVYYIVDFFENGWEEFFGEEIREIHRSSVDLNEFTAKYNRLKLRARKILLERFGLTKQDLEDYYQEFYNDYIFISSGPIKVWSYNKRRVKSSVN